MSRFTQMLLSGLAVLVLSACTSLQDFEAMSPHERATAVCQRQGDVRQYQANISRHERLIWSAQQAISKGHRKEQVCEQRQVETGSTTSCESMDEGNSTRVVCKEKKEYTKQRVCFDRQVPVDVALEQSNMNIWREILNT
ncbi:MAG TPA: hypothetical protein VIC53_02975, partial [Wenzhouxiangella sp.]